MRVPPVWTPWSADFAVRLNTSKDKEDTFDLSTFDPDADDEGRAHDYGVPVFEDATIVGDTTRDGYDAAKVRGVLSLLEHAPDLAGLLDAFVTERQSNARIRERATRLLAEIRNGELKYAGR